MMEVVVMMIRARGCRRAVSQARPARRLCSSTRRQLRMQPRAQNLRRCFYNSHLSCLVQPRLLEGLSLLLRELLLAKLLQELLLLARLGLSLLMVMWMEGSPRSANTSRYTINKQVASPFFSPPVLVSTPPFCSVSFPSIPGIK